MFAKIKALWRAYREEIIFSSILVLVALLAFGLGRLSTLAERGKGFEIVYPETSQGAAAILAEGSYYVASKTGTKYHLP